MQNHCQVSVDKTSFTDAGYKIPLDDYANYRPPPMGDSGDKSHDNSQDIQPRNATRDHHHPKLKASATVNAAGRSRRILCSLQEHLPI